VASAAAPAAETNIRVTLDTRLEGPSAPFLVPLDKGYYRSEGLNVSVSPADGTREAIDGVALGTADMGVTDINALIRFRDANPAPPVMAVFIVYNRPPFCIIGRKSHGIVKPKDLEGKKLGAPASGSAFAQWPIFVKVNDIDASKVTIENIGIPVREPIFASGQVSAITGLTLNSYINLKERGVPLDDITVLLMADYGVELYGNAIVVNAKFAAEHPDAVKAFLRAFVKGLKDVVRSPAAAIESVLKRNDTARRDIELERLTMAIRDNIVTPEVKARGYGGIDPARMQKAIEQIGIAYKFKAPPPKPEDITLTRPSFCKSPAPSPLRLLEGPMARRYAELAVLAKAVCSA
jgi:NitT/TauT family transport system substrate-binding protein